QAGHLHGLGLLGKDAASDERKKKHEQNTRGWSHGKASITAKFCLAGEEREIVSLKGHRFVNVVLFPHALDARVGHPAENSLNRYFLGESFSGYFRLRARQLPGLPAFCRRSAQYDRRKRGWNDMKSSWKKRIRT